MGFQNYLELPGSSGPKVIKGKSKTISSYLMILVIHHHYHPCPNFQLCHK